MTKWCFVIVCRDAHFSINKIQIRCALNCHTSCEVLSPYSPHYTVSTSLVTFYIVIKSSVSVDVSALFESSSQNSPSALLTSPSWCPPMSCATSFIAFVSILICLHCQCFHIPESLCWAWGFYSLKCDAASLDEWFLLFQTNILPSLSRVKWTWLLRRSATSQKTKILNDTTQTFHCWISSHGISCVSLKVSCVCWKCSSRQLTCSSLSCRKFITVPPT